MEQYKVILVDDEVEVIDVMKVNGRIRVPFYSLQVMP